MSGVRAGTRLQQLQALRTRIDQEIQAELLRVHIDEAGRVRPREPATTAELLVHHDLTSHQVKAWAHQQGLIPAVTRGRVSRALVEAYLEQNGTPQ